MFLLVSMPWGVIPPWLVAFVPLDRALLQDRGQTCELNEINRLALARNLKLWCQKCHSVAEITLQLCHIYHGTQLALGD